MTSQWIKIPCPACGPLAREVVGSAALSTDELNAITEYLLDQHRVWKHQTTRIARPALPGGDWKVKRPTLCPVWEDPECETQAWNNLNPQYKPMQCGKGAV